MKIWISMFAIAALTSLVCVLLVATKGSSDEGIARTRTAVSVAPPKMERVRATADPWRTEANVEQSRADEPTGSAVEAATAPPPAPSTDAIRDRMGEIFASERLDEGWDGAELARLEKALPALLPPGSRIDRVECRSTMCRIESTHAGLDAFVDFARAAFSRETRVNEGPFFASVSAPPVAGQPVSTVAFIARKGHILPMPERIAAQ